MSKSLLIVESPTKARTLSKYLGRDYIVMASMGHVKDLPRHKMGVDVEHDFEPEYRVIEGKHKVIGEMKRAAEDVDRVYLAPDPDREGEAIAWHIAEILNGEKKRTLMRVLFIEITEKGVEHGLANPLQLDRKKFESQQARRILDRLVGYEISPILWKKVKGGLSAGRVQSVALRLIVDREAEIRAFEPREYWHILATLARDGMTPPDTFKAQLTHVDGEKASVASGADAEAIRADLSRARFSVLEVKQTERKRRPPAPYITSKLQQEATRRLRMTARKVMQIAQQLYEGVEVGAEGSVGLITYMRTDSTRLADEAVQACRSWIAGNFGQSEVPRTPNVYPQKKSAQGAHEAIRPTSMSFPPSAVKDHLTRDQYALYTLVWNRFVACQMRPAIYTTTQVRIDASGDRPAGEGAPPRVYELRVTGSRLLSPGWLAIEEDTSRKAKKQAEGAEADGEGVPETSEASEGGVEVESLPELSEGDSLSLHDPGVVGDQKFTKPPPRFSEGSLIKEMEERGIGRPSTYATIISTIQERRYVRKLEQRFQPTPLGEIVTDRLRSHFSEILDVDFTARMEEKLDDIESGKVEWSKLLADFYTPFHASVLQAMKTMKNGVDKGEYEKYSALSGVQGSRIEADLDCPKCQSRMIVRSGRYGEFLSCSGFPKCRESMPIYTGISCPVAGCGGTIVERRARKGRKFYGCSKYDETKCDYVLWVKPVKKKCPTCGAPFLGIKRSRTGTSLVCVAEGCEYSEEVSP